MEFTISSPGAPEPEETTDPVELLALTFLIAFLSFLLMKIFNGEERPNPSHKEEFRPKRHLDYVEPYPAIHDEHYGRPLRIVHLSDTHGLHREIPPLPKGDILIHTGDFTENGTPKEISAFNDWLGEAGKHFRHVLVILGNHDCWDIRNRVAKKEIDPNDAVNSSFIKENLCKITNGRLLINEEVEVDGLRIFGSSWAPWQKDGNPEGTLFVGDHEGMVKTREAWFKSQKPDFFSRHEAMDLFSRIPDGLDILMTHGPATDILDTCRLDSKGKAARGSGWGSSKKLREAIQTKKPRVHLFGHLHEQRGLWTKGTFGTRKEVSHVDLTGPREKAPGFTGGIEYKRKSTGLLYPTIGPPPPDYPCELVSNNAMCNHKGMEGGKAYIAGTARLIHMYPRSSRM